MNNIYIVLSQTGTVLSRLIQSCTKAPYNHVSISFDEDLDVLYSFGRKNPHNAFSGGFVTENLHKGVYAMFPDARCCVFKVSVTEEEYCAMKEALSLFLKNKEEYSYNLMGVISNVFGFSICRKNKFFCSQFVSYLLNKTSFWNSLPEFTKPMDFYSLKNKTVVYEGDITSMQLTS